MHAAVLVAIQQTSPLPLPSPPPFLSQPMHSLLKQKRDHITLVELGCKVQWRLLLCVENVNDVQPRGEKGGGDFDEPMTSGKVQGRDFLVFCCMDVCTIEQQDTNNLLIPILTGKMERGAELIVLGSNKLPSLLEPVLED